VRGHYEKPRLHSTLVSHALSSVMTTTSPSSFYLLRYLLLLYNGWENNTRVIDIVCLDVGPNRESVCVCEDALSLEGAPLILLERYFDIQQYFSHPKLTGSEKALPINMKLRLYQTRLRLLIANHLNQSINQSSQSKADVRMWGQPF